MWYTVGVHRVYSEELCRSRCGLSQNVPQGVDAEKQKAVSQKKHQAEGEREEKDQPCYGAFGEAHVSREEAEAVGDLKVDRHQRADENGGVIAKGGKKPSL